MNIIWIDITDLIRWCINHNHFSGIQRIEYSFGLSDKLDDIPNIKPCFLSPIDNEFYQIDREELKQAIDTGDKAYLRKIWHHKVNFPSEKNMFRRFRRSIKKRMQAYELKHNPIVHQVDFKENDVIVVLQAYWITPNYTNSIGKAKKAYNIRCYPFIHDVIPFLTPHLIPNINTLVQQRLLLNISDGAVTSTQYTKDIMFESKKISFAMPFEKDQVVITPFGSSKFQSNEDKTNYIVHKQCNGQDFVLMVGTIEPRKNHIYMVEIWEKLYQKHGDKLPLLIIAGRKGWKAEHLLNLLASKNYIDNKVKILYGLSDEHVDGLFKHCLFTAFPSFSEGWGLPIHESLRYNKLCIASNHPVLQDVGKHLCEYVNPYDVNDGLKMVEHYLFNAEKRHEKEALIAQQAEDVLYDWDQAAQIFFKEVSKII